MGNLKILYYMNDNCQFKDIYLSLDRINLNINSILKTRRLMFRPIKFT